MFRRFLCVQQAVHKYTHLHLHFIYPAQYYSIHLYSLWCLHMCPYVCACVGQVNVRCTLYVRTVHKLYNIKHVCCATEKKKKQWTVGMMIVFTLANNRFGLSFKYTHAKRFTFSIVIFLLCFCVASFVFGVRWMFFLYAKFAFTLELVFRYTETFYIK